MIFVCAELKAFKSKFGHVNVPRSKEFTDLGQFVGNQRYFYRRRLVGEKNRLVIVKFITHKFNNDIDALALLPSSLSIISLFFHLCATTSTSVTSILV